MTDAVRRPPNPLRLLRVGFGAPTALVNAWESLQDDVEARAERDRLMPGSGAGGTGSLEAISVDECWKLLATVSLGRVGFTAHSGQPVILPVNYTVVDRRVLIRSGRGPKLEAAKRGDLVAFEVDRVDEEQHSGWSVTISGRARWVQDVKELAANTLVMPSTWAAGPRNEQIVIDPIHIAGRRLLA